MERQVGEHKKRAVTYQPVRFMNECPAKRVKRSTDLFAVE
jgi:hypothetical protein